MKFFIREKRVNEQETVILTSQEVQVFKKFQSNS
jgi:hypothetical protein